MDESLTERCRVRDEGLRVVNRCQLGGRLREERSLTYLQRKSGLSSCQQPRQDEPDKRYSELLGLKGAQAAWQVRCESPRLNRGIALHTAMLEGDRGKRN
eukprot:TRINITY_DN3042_c0_g1_i10.p4 TRINITY_DN3042_c0_g1~~TRINITY_DN3042_c0_g1_i10.p4  ORF type:complete len:100 (-),score=4.60 TRINITY_DN3042_c0_g1_i10:174-473(-)